jgi:hypothetical protein
MLTAFLAALKAKKGNDETHFLDKKQVTLKL